MKIKHCFHLDKDTSAELESFYLDLRKKHGNKISKSMIVDISLVFFFAHIQEVQDILKKELDKADKK